MDPRHLRRRDDHSAPRVAVTLRGGTAPVGVWRRVAGPQGNNVWFWVFVGPFVLGLVAFVAVPILWSLYLSFFEARNTVTPSDFVGLGNYRDMLSDPEFRSSLTTFVAFAAFIVPLTFVCALALALLVNRVRLAQAFFRSVFFVPVACSYVVASMIWKMSIFNGVRFGLANTLLRAVGVEGRQWLSRPHPPLYWIVIVSERLWLQVGFYMLLFLAGLQRIPQVLYEAAAVDGAQSGWQTFRYITLPQFARDVSRSARAVADQCVPGVRRVLQPDVEPGRGHLSAVRSPAARVPVLHRARHGRRTSAMAAPGRSSSR